MSAKRTTSRASIRWIGGRHGPIHAMIVDRIKGHNHVQFDLQDRALTMTVKATPIGVRLLTAAGFATALASCMASLDPEVLQHISWCDNEKKSFSNDQQITGCTALIESGKFDDTILTTAFYNRAGAYYANRDNDRAIADYGAVIRRDPRRAAPFNNRGAAHARNRDFERAIADFDEAIRIDPQYGDGYNNRGAARSQNGDYDSAIADFGEALRINPRDATAFNNRGLAYNRKGDYDRAIADFGEAVRINPRYAAAFYNRAQVHTRQGDYDRAIADYDQTIMIDPGQADAFNNRGVAYSFKGDYDRAIADSDQAILINPRHVDALSNRSAAFLAKADYDRAIADAERALQIDPRFAAAFNNRGAAYRGKRDLNRALADYDQAIRLDPNNADAFHNRGLVRFMLGRFTEASNDLARRIELVPTDGYSALWLYLSRARDGEDSPDALARASQSLNPAIWPGPVTRLFRGQVSSDQLRMEAAAGRADTTQIRTCQAVFYTAQYHLLRGNTEAARSLLQEASANCPHNCNEYESAVADLARLQS